MGACCALLSGLLTSCATVERRGARLSAEPFEHQCADSRARGSLRVDGEQVHLTVTAISTCRSGERISYATERYGNYWLLAGALGTGVTVAVGVPLTVAAVALIKDHMSGPGATFGYLLVLPAVALGLVVFGAVGVPEHRMPDGPPERVEKVTSSEDQVRAPSGTVKSQGPPALQWSVVDGEATLPLAQAREVNLGQLLFAEHQVELDGRSADLAEGLDACRRALTRWSASEPVECPAARRLELAQRCARGGWDFAQAVEQRIRRACPAEP